VAYDSSRAGDQDQSCSPDAQPGWGDRILVPMDGSEEAAQALPVARGIAGILGATVHIVHASQTPVPLEEMANLLGLKRDELAGVVIDRIGGLPDEALIRVQHDSHLSPIVLSARGRGTPVEQSIGPVAAEVIQHATGPVLLVWPEHDVRIGRPGVGVRRIILPLDGTPSTAFAIGPAIDLAQKSRAELFLLYVAVTGKQRPQEPGTLTPPRYLDQPQYEWPSWATELLERLWQASGCKPARIPVRIAMVSGEPTEEIARFATEHQSDLIAFAWQGRFIRGGPWHVANRLREAGCPVLFLHALPKVALGQQRARPPKGRERRQAA
jgi:nucleotide-binding universal stress UspA family protein